MTDIIAVFLMLFYRQTVPLHSNTKNFGFYILGYLVADIVGGKEAEGVSEHGVEENIWT